MEETRQEENVLRIWPVLLIAMLGLWCLFGPTYLEQHDVIRFGTLALGGLGQVVLILVWTLGFSRAKLKTKIWMSLFGIVFLAVAWTLQSKSLGISILLYGVPIANLCLAIMLLITRNQAWGLRRFLLALAWSLPILVWDLARSDGYEASFFPEVRWRWSPTSESRLADSQRAEFTNQTVSVTPTSNDWVRFRGPKIDGQSTQFNLPTGGISVRDVWRKPAGPSWSSLISVGDFLFTIEQRGVNEAVVCLDKRSGETKWLYQYPCRFEDSTQVSGAGPRGTPTFHQGKLYVVGGKGNIKAINASDGSLVWEREILQDVGGNIPQWGFSTSPLLIDDNCYVMSNCDNESTGCIADIVCYDANDGTIRWKGDSIGATYSSPTLVELAGIPQLLVAHSGVSEPYKGQQVISRDPATGKELWRYSSPEIGLTMTTPLQLNETSLLIVDGPSGLTRLEVTHKPTSQEWSIKKVWSQARVLPEYSDVVVQADLAIALSKGFLIGVDLNSGKVLWRERGFGGGQLIGVPGAIIVQAESGKLMLYQVDKKGPKLLAESEGLKGKTWNHPIQVGQFLFARNAQDIACFELISTN